HELGVHVSRVADDRDRTRLLLRAAGLDAAKRGVEIRGDLVEVAGVEPTLDARRIDLDAEEHAAGHGRGERLRAAHAAEATRQHEAPAEIAAKMSAPRGHERLERALHDALRADVDPRSRGHLSVHHQALALELAEVVPR